MSIFLQQINRADQDTLSLEAIGRAFIDAYAKGDRDAMLALCAPDAETHYLPWGEAGWNSIAKAVDVWTRYPASFDDFAMPILSVAADPTRRVVIISTMNSGIQATPIDGIPNSGSQMACPHLFVVTVDADGLIQKIDVWCDQLTLYRQLGFPADFDTSGDVR